MSKCLLASIPQSEYTPDIHRICDVKFWCSEAWETTPSPPTLQEVSSGPANILFMCFFFFGCFFRSQNLLKIVYDPCALDLGVSEVLWVIVRLIEGPRFSKHGGRIQGRSESGFPIGPSPNPSEFRYMFSELLLQLNLMTATMQKLSERDDSPRSSWNCWEAR